MRKRISKLVKGVIKMLMKLKALVEQLGISEYCIRKSVRDGSIPCYVISGKYFFDMAEVEEWLQNNKHVS